MESINFQPLAKTMAINSIIAYQNYISPRKGFSCPHRLLHGGDSCSDYIKRSLTEQSLTEAVKSSLQRFKDCASASKILTTTTSANNFRCIIIPCCIPL
ncbi:MAG: membrane protein insertion efficiency factor YidD [Fischerella sp.]|jgi:putative component of membrane protein insertase Oxa1/YidC/SpoIIIJ protein YidD|nr:membrane protein insertion efficiency factor YidD [Fischerella sp.]